MDSDLEEQEFIHEGLGKNPRPFWFWLTICVLATAFIWIVSNWAEDEKEAVYGSTPFLQVTNRDFSLFLWQNPEFMKRNLKSNRNYLSAWGNDLTVDPEEAEKWVEAPNDALFMYHTWKRLVGDYFYPRNIPQKEFTEFLKADPQWHPKYWKKAPDAYITLVKWIEAGSKFDDLKEVSYNELPKIVRQAFVGWKNFTKESEKINSIRPTFRQIWTFLNYYPNFKRPFWINLVRQERPNYLKSEMGQVSGFETVPDSEMDGLLQMGIYNYLTQFSSLSPPA